MIKKGKIPGSSTVVVNGQPSRSHSKKQTHLGPMEENKGNQHGELQ
jgi:hypothetical protein